MDNLYLITTNDRAEFLVKEFGNRIKTEKYDSECVKVTFEQFNNFDLLLLFHAGIACGSETWKDFYQSRMF
jgi:hypothetical protein